MVGFLKLKKSNCKNCYKCIRHCPVKSIRFSDGRVTIVKDECILCGRCFVVCPQNAKEIASELNKARLLAAGGHAVASVAPSFAANYPGVGIGAMEKALRQLGFAAAQETALGATIVKKEYERILREERPPVAISSCCASVNLLIRRHYPELLPLLLPVVTPLQAHCMELKRRDPAVKTVFIGPCVSKKEEALESGGLIDAVLTFEELTAWLRAEGITLERERDSEAFSRARLFPVSGGVTATMDRHPDYTYMTVEGVDKCMTVLNELRKGALPERCFIEMSACVGGCVGGPVMEKYHNTPVRNYAEVVSYAGKEDFRVNMPSPTECARIRTPVDHADEQPDEALIAETLVRMGKKRRADELNCGSCGYDTCREKAIAIIQGKAELSMCLPYMMSRAESFSDTVVQNSPNAILVLSDSLEIQKINPVARRLLKADGDVLGQPIDRLIGADGFAEVRAGKREISGDRVYLAKYERYVDRTIVYNGEYHIFICIMRDVTGEVAERERKIKSRRQAADIADRVAEKQLKIVQDIAYLLGETAADTQIALTRLKETISDD